jgi:hypothetical protein
MQAPKKNSKKHLEMWSAWMDYIRTIAKLMHQGRSNSSSILVLLDKVLHLLFKQPISLKLSKQLDHGKVI